MIKLTLPYPLSANKYWRPVVVKGHSTMVPTKEAKAYREAIGWVAQQAGVRRPFEGRVKVDVLLYPQRPQDWAKRVRDNPLAWDDDVRCIDLDNARKVLYDSLKGVVFVDDKWVFEDSARRMEPDGEARVIVTVSRIAVITPQANLLEATA